MIGIIGGSGFEDPGLFDREGEESVRTEWGEPSSTLLRGRLAGREVALLSRHGRRHEIPPSQINNRANIAALKAAGCGRIVATAACGSLRDIMDRGHLVIPDQFIDCTRHRVSTFHEAFKPGIENAIHTPMADPFDAAMRTALVRAGRELGLSLHDGGTLVTIEGPRFSTRAESRMFRIWGADLVNMTIAPEAVLANEIGLPYAVVAMVTDFDSWKEDEPPLRLEDVLTVFHSNVESLTRLIHRALPDLDP